MLRLKQEQEDMEESSVAPNAQTDEEGGSESAPAPKRAKGNVTIRDRLLLKEVNELGTELPPTCELRYDEPDELHDFYVTIKPEEGYWKGGTYLFHVAVPDSYNMTPPVVKCKTRLWHPNINEEGAICLSLLRQSSIDEMGWSPARRIKDVIWGLNSLFTDLLNFDDPLNQEAAEMYQKDPDAFQIKVKDYIKKYAKN